MQRNRKDGRSQLPTGLRAGYECFMFQLTDKAGRDNRLVAVGDVQGVFSSVGMECRDVRVRHCREAKLGELIDDVFVPPNTPSVVQSPLPLHYEPETTVACCCC